MGIDDLFQFTSVHAHINLIGWLSLAVTGAICHIFPLAGENKIAIVHFWLKMIGVPLLLFGMILFGLGKLQIASFISGVGGILILIGALLFVINIVKNVKVEIKA